jgi:glycosyltransferase involved in cell wall biosynthesis
MPDELTPRLKIAWFTPLSCKSAIGEFSCHVAAALSELADVTIWTSDELPHHPTNVEIVVYRHDSANLQLLEGFDVVVYNMGDYLPFHGHMYRVAQRHPGVVVLHDRVLHHLFAGMWLKAPANEREIYVERMGAYYGREGRELARASLLGERAPVWESDAETLRYPLYEEGIRGARGVVTHSQAQADDIRKRWLGPVRALHLPCYGEVLQRTSGEPLADSNERVQLLTVGHLNPNKQVHRVAEIIAADPELAAKVHYTVVGPDDGFKDYVRDLRRWVARHPEVSIEILGWRSEEELHRLMERADVFVNLRHPVMEGGSASLMRQLAYGRGILCFESGFFMELPEGSVVRVLAGDFSAAACALRELVSNSKHRCARGAQARAVAAAYDERSYAEGLLELIEDSRRATPALSLLDAVAGKLGEMAVDSRLPVFDEIANDFARILPL